MKYRNAIIILAFMLSRTELIAQQKINSVKWDIAGQLTSMPGEQAAIGVAGPVAGWHNNVMIVGGGANFPDSMPWQGGKKKYHNRIYIFSKKNSQLNPVAGNFSLPENIAYTANCITPHGVFAAGGENENGILNRTFLLRWDDKNKLVVIDTLPSLPLAVTNAVAVNYNDVVFVVGGEMADGVSDKCWELDLKNPFSGWKALAPFPKPISHGVFIAMQSNKNTSLYMFGGRRKMGSGISEFYNSVYTYNLNLNQWDEAAHLPYPLSAGSGVATSKGIVLFGGDRGATFNKVEKLIAGIGSTSDAVEKAKLVQQKNELLSSHPGFSHDVLLYNIVSGNCKTISQIPYPSPVTTTAFWCDNRVAIPSGEIKAGVRTPQIITAKLRRNLK